MAGICLLLPVVCCLAEAGGGKGTEAAVGHRADGFAVLAHGPLPASPRCRVPKSRRGSGCSKPSLHLSHTPSPEPVGRELCEPWASFPTPLHPSPSSLQSSSQRGPSSSWGSHWAQGSPPPLISPASCSAQPGKLVVPHLEVLLPPMGKAGLGREEPGAIPLGGGWG